MLNLDPGKLLIIVVVAVLLLGPDKLPHAARQVGNTWRSINDFRHRMEAEVRSNIPDLPSTGELTRLARSPTALLNHFGDMTSANDVTTPRNDPTSVISTDLPNTAVVRDGGEMSWVTAELSSAPIPSPGSNTLEVRPSAVVVVGDANLN